MIYERLHQGASGRRPVSRYRPAQIAGWFLLQRRDRSFEFVRCYGGKEQRNISYCYELEIF